VPDRWFPGGPSGWARLYPVSFFTSQAKRSGLVLTKRDIASATAFGPPRS
jgi:hypothetical protein